MMQTALIPWHRASFFSFCWQSLKNIIILTFKIFKIIIPNSIQGFAWGIRTIFKLVVLFFGLVILLIGPRLGLPRSVFQATWSILVRLGCVTTEDIVRLGHGAASAADGDQTTNVRMVAGQLIRLGYRNLDVAVAASILSATVKGIISEMFWTTVELLGLKHYFQNVARHKERLATKQSGTAGTIASAVAGAAGAVADAVSTVTGDGTDGGEKSEEQEGSGLAMILYQLEKGSEWGIHCAQSWWSRRQKKRERKLRQNDRQARERRYRAREEKVNQTAELLMGAEAEAAYAIRLAAIAEEEAEQRSALLHAAEQEYEAACAAINSGTAEGSSDANAGNNGSGGGGGWLSWALGEDFAVYEQPAPRSAEQRLAEAEAALVDANWAATEAMREREERVAQRVQALEAVERVEEAHGAALAELRRCRRPSPTTPPAPPVHAQGRSFDEDESEQKGDSSSDGAANGAAGGNDEGVVTGLLSSLFGAGGSVSASEAAGRVLQSSESSGGDVATRDDGQASGEGRTDTSVYGSDETGLSISQADPEEFEEAARQNEAAAAEERRMALESGRDAGECMAAAREAEIALHMEEESALQYEAPAAKKMEAARQKQALADAKREELRKAQAAVEEQEEDAMRAGKAADREEEAAQQYRRAAAEVMERLKAQGGIAAVSSKEYKDSYTTEESGCAGGADGSLNAEEGRFSPDQGRTEGPAAAAVEARPGGAADEGGVRHVIGEF